MSIEEIKEIISNNHVLKNENYKGYTETNEAWLIRTNDYYFKVRKPIKTDYSDLSQLDNRKDLTYHELRLNNELSEQTYETVVPLFESETESKLFNKEENIVDYALKIKRLNKRNNLMYRLENQYLIESLMVREIASKIADFHMQTDIIRNTYNITGFQKSYEELQRTEFFVKDLIGKEQFSLLMESFNVTHNFLNDNRYLLQERTLENRIINGHGNLGAENIYLNHQVVIVNRLINKEDRIIDQLLDLARLGIDFDFFDRGDLDDVLLITYFKKTKQKLNKQHKKLYTFYKLYQLSKVLTTIIDRSTLFTLDMSQKNQIYKYFNLMSNYMQFIRKY